MSHSLTKAESLSRRALQVLPLSLQAQILHHQRVFAGDEIGDLVSDAWLAAAEGHSCPFARARRQARCSSPGQVVPQMAVGATPAEVLDEIDPDITPEHRAKLEQIDLSTTAIADHFGVSRAQSFRKRKKMLDELMAECPNIILF